MLESLTWRAALAVSVDPAVIAAMSEQQFLAAVHGQLVLPGGKKLWRRIAIAVHAAPLSPAGSPGSVRPSRSVLPSPSRTG